MALLVILLPARPRAADALSADEPAAQLSWLLSPDGLAIGRQGRSTPSLLPKADSVVAVVPATELGWHRITCPKAPANRLRAALGGLLEEQLLDDDRDVHLALAPEAGAGRPTWVAALHKPWLLAQLAALQAAGHTVDRVVPALSPGGEAAAHVFTAEGEVEPAGAWLALGDADTALCLPLAGGTAQVMLSRWLARGVQLSATPAAATQAGRALAAAGGEAAAVVIRSDAEQALAAVRSGWQLLQFELAPTRRGTRALGSLLQQFMRPAWRPARLGLVALAVVQGVGLNASAWQQQRTIAERRAEMDSLLRSSFPRVRSVLDAPLQMARETSLLREAAGVPGDGDFETLLGAAAAAWPPGQPPAPQLRFEPGRLSLPAAGWTPPQLEQFRQQLQSAGWALEQADGRLTLLRGSRQSAR